jgi:hypothetical protein
MSYYYWLKNFQFATPEVFNAKPRQNYDFILYTQHQADTNVVMARIHLGDYIRKVCGINSRDPVARFEFIELKDGTIPLDNVPKFCVDTKDWIPVWLFHYKLRYPESLHICDKKALVERYFRFYGARLSENDAAQLQVELLEDYDQKMYASGFLPVNHEMVRQGILDGSIVIIPGIKPRNYRRDLLNAYT